MNTAVLKKTNSWTEFTALLSGFSKKEKGDAFEELTRHYLTLHPTYVTQLESVWHHRNIRQRFAKS